MLMFNVIFKIYFLLKFGFFTSVEKKELLFLPADNDIDEPHVNDPSLVTTFEAKAVSRENSNNSQPQFVDDLRTEDVSPLPFEHNIQPLSEDEQPEEDINSPEDIPDEKKNRNRKKEKKNKKSKKKKKNRRRSRSKTESDNEFEPTAPVEGSPVSSDPDFGGPHRHSPPPVIRASLPLVEETSPISSEGSAGLRRNGRDFSSADDFEREDARHSTDHMFDVRRGREVVDRPRRPPQTPPEPSPEGDTTPLGEHSPVTPTYASGGGRHPVGGRGPRTPEGPSPPPMDRNSRLCEDSPPPAVPFIRGRGAPRTPEGSPQGLHYDPEDAMTSPPRHLHGRGRSHDRHLPHGTIAIHETNGDFN